MFSRTACVFALVIALLPLASRAASDTELQELRKELDAMRANYEARLQQLEARLKKAEADAAQSASQAAAPHRCAAFDCSSGGAGGNLVIKRQRV